MPFGFGDDPSDYLDQIIPMLKKYLGPYAQRGEEAGGILSGEFGPMATDPAAFMSSMMEKYKPSKSYQLQSEQMRQAAANAAAAGGMRGSESDIARQSGIAERLQGQDMQNWLQNVMGIKKTGLTGEEGLYGKGFGAASELSSGIGNVLGSQARLSMEQEQQLRQFLSDLLGNVGSAGGFGRGSAGASIGMGKGTTF